MPEIPVKKARDKITKEQYKKYFRVAREQYEKIVNAIPENELFDRLTMYRRLRRNYFPPTQAFNIVTATRLKGHLKLNVPGHPEMGSGWVHLLQRLDLNHPEWRKRIARKRQAMKNQAQQLVILYGYTPSKAMRIIIENADILYRQSGESESWDLFDDYIKGKQAKRKTKNDGKNLKKRDAKVARRNARLQEEGKRARMQGGFRF